MLQVNLQIQQLEVHFSIMQNGMLVTSMLRCQGLRLVHDISPLHLLSPWLINTLRPREGSHLCATCMKSPQLAEFNAGHHSHLFQCFPKAHYWSDCPIHVFPAFFFPSLFLFLSLCLHLLSLFLCLLSKHDGWTDYSSSCKWGRETVMLTLQQHNCSRPSKTYKLSLHCHL